MLTTKSRARYTDWRFDRVQIAMHCCNQGWSPSFAYGGAAVYTTGPMQELYEILRSEDKGHSKWNPCQHYKRATRYSNTAGKLHVTTVTDAAKPPYSTDIEAMSTPYQVQAKQVIRENPRVYPNVRLQGLPCVKAWETAAPVALLGAPGQHLIGVPQLVNEVDESGNFIPDPPNLAALQDASLRAIIPKMKEEISLINSVIELKDFKTLPTTFRNIRNFAGRLEQSANRSFDILHHKLWGNVRRVFARDRGPTLREALSAGADSHLTWSFAIKPLLDDVCGIFHALRRTQSRVNDLVNRQGHRRVQHFTMPVPQTATDLLTEAPFAFTGGVGYTGSMEEIAYSDVIPNWTKPKRWFDSDGKLVRRVLPPSVTFHAQLDYNFHFSRFQIENAQLLGMLDALGINLNPAIVWNALPWTFVLDWVINVSRWLDARKTLNLEPIININKYLWSCKTTRLTTVTITNYRTSVKTYHLPVLLHVLEEQAYKRDTSLINGNSLITSGVSSRELILGASLLVPRRWRPKRGLSNLEK